MNKEQENDVLIFIVSMVSNVSVSRVHMYTTSFASDKICKESS